MSWPRLRLWPTGLAGQIVACVILALLISQSLTGLLAVVLEPHGPPPAFPMDTATGGSLEPRGRPPEFPMDTATRVALIIDALDAASASERPRIAAAVGRRDIQIVVGAAGNSTVTPDAAASPDAMFFGHMVEERLGRQFSLQMSETQSPSGKIHPISVLARLGDGSFVTIRATIMGPPNFVESSLRPFLFYLPFVALAIVMLTIWATRRVTAPLRAFADAAERLGNERSAPPLAERGPAELLRAARSFNKMQEQVKRFVDDRTRMLAAISHDMRTPITRLRLRVEDVVTDEGEQQKMLQDLDRMDAMVASALSFLRDGTRDEPVELVDLASLLESVCDDFSDTGRDVSYVGLANFSMRCRPAMLGRAMTNLIENALKFAGVATVDLQCDGDGNAVIHVDDDGPGIPDAEKAKAFDPFYRLDPARSFEIGGVGLGLSIAQSIVQIHDGKIALADRVPRGLRVIVTLPAFSSPR